ncbi:glycosyltransferase N-terminal domain-containing protein [Thioalkalivibrio sp.]|uniref:glycosyltransferase N-terminal domain-containing protein n=1 Tax=Thioalkalivibrio sp. TaxID=2093813 RepID=UPI0039755B32
MERGYGAGFGPVWRAVLRDYRDGLGKRARARLGLLTPPEGRGRLLWIKAGASPDALRLGVELLGTVRDRRRDLRLVMTFERDDPDLLRARLRPWQRVGIGYGPCDRPRVVTRVLARFQPCGIILAESEPPANLLARTLAPVAAIGTAAASVPVATAWPVSAPSWRDWQANGHAGELMPPADPQARLAEAQADVVLRTLAGGGDRRLWWWHGRAQQWPDWLAAWRGMATAADDILMASFADTGVPAEAALSVTAWDRSSLAGGSVLHIDDRRWFAAAASAADGVHLADPARDVLWQALAAGCAVSLGAEAAAASLPVPVLTAPGAVIDRWRGLRGDENQRRSLGDAARRRFWEERRQVDANLSALMDRVWTW